MSNAAATTNLEAARAQCREHIKLISEMEAGGGHGSAAWRKATNEFAQALKKFGESGASISDISWL